MKKTVVVNYIYDNMCQECGGSMPEQIDIFICECDHCLAKKAE